MTTIALTPNLPASLATLSQAARSLAVFGEPEHAGAADVLARARDERGLAVGRHQTTPPARSFSIAGLS
jgi:hypothetical protein